MISTQFIEQQWNKSIAPAIRVTCNAVSMAKNFACAVFFGPQEYQGIGVKNTIISPGNHSHHRISE